MVPDNSIDVIVSNCVLNLVSDDLKKNLFKEMYRVLKI
jgi:arsenite methyltransferase